MVVAFLGSVGLFFYRSTVNSKNADAIRDAVEALSPLEPHEVEDLRCTNDLPPRVFEEVAAAVRENFPTGTATYPEFVRVVTEVLKRPLELGYLLDRAVLGTGAVPPEAVAVSGGSIESPRLFHTDFLLAAFSMAVNTTFDERVSALFDMMASYQRPSGDSGDSGGSFSGGSASASASEGEQQRLSAAAVAKLVELLQASHQLPATKYSARAEVWFPAQQYRLARGSDLLERALADAHEEAERQHKGWLERKMSPPFRLSEAVEGGFDRTQVARILRSHAVCAWGECFP